MAIRYKSTLFISLFVSWSLFAFAQPEFALGSDTLYGQHKHILLLLPNLKIVMEKGRPPVMDFVEAELTAGLDDDLCELLITSTGDSSRVISRNLRNQQLYEKAEAGEADPVTACGQLDADAIFLARYSFYDMPTLYSNRHQLSSQVSELRAEFTIYDCKQGKIVWRANHSEFTPAPKAAYNDLLKKMYSWIERELPYKR